MAIKKYQYKFLNLQDGKIKSNNGDHAWEIGEWYTHKGMLILCESGFHCSKKIIDAFSYVRGDVVARVEYEGKTKSDHDKLVCQKMRIVDARLWKKEDSVELAIFSAEQVIDIYEKEYPEDRRPRKAIEAAKKWLKNPTDRNAAYTTYAAAYAARAA